MKKKVITISVMVGYAILYMFSLKNNMIFGGDTIQYLNMAYKVQNMEWPMSQNWMPSYGIVIGMVSWITGNVLNAAIAVNLIITLAVIYVINLCLREWFPHSRWAYVAGYSLVLTNREFYYHSLSMMAELPMLLVFLTALYIITKTFKANQVLVNENIKWLSLLSLVGMFTKYNAIILIIMIIALLWAWNDYRNKFSKTLLFIVPIAIPYGIWAIIKPGSEVIVTALIKPAFVKGFLENTHYFWIAFWDYFTSPQISAWYSTLNPMISMFLWLLCMVGFIFCSWRGYITDSLHKPWFLLTAFVCIYVIGFTYIATTTGRFEITIRQLNYPFFIIPFLGIFILKYFIKKRLFYFTGMSLLVSFIMVGGFKMYGRFHAFRNKGYGELAGTNYSVSEYECLQYAFKYISDNGIESNQIYTNKHKVLGIHFNFQVLNKLPTSLNWRGNHTFYLKGKAFHDAMYIMLVNLANNGILIFVNDDFQELCKKYETFIDDKLVLVTFSDGFVIHKK